MIDGVLYRLAADNGLRIIPPTKMREQLFEEAHQGAFGGMQRCLEKYQGTTGGQE